MRANPKGTRFVLGVLAAGILLSLGGRGDVAGAEGRAEDPEYGSTFGRVRFLDGGMSLERTGEGEVTDATVNDPVAPGDRLVTEDGRAEIGLSEGSTLWLDRGTRLDVRSLADIDNRYESTNLFALESGSIRIDAPDPGNRKKACRVDTEAGSIYLLSAGSFRIEIDEDVATLYSFRGVAELSGDDGSVLVRSGERSSVQPGRAPSEPRRFNTARLDDFDRFCEGRREAYLRHDRDETGDLVVDEVPYEVHPYISELSLYGAWHRVPEYGWVWRPVYYGSWSPYLNGYWSWCRTGWVWVSYDPWGWAPYHYGRWDFAVDVGWIWIPGRVWSGAWVSFAVGTSHIGWCPLNYYNRPVFQDTTIVNVVSVNVTRLQPRGWRFVPVEQFANPRGPRAVVRVDRLPRGTEVVITSRLPRFNPHEVGGRPERGVRFVENVRQTRAPLPVVVGRDDKPLPFRSVERNARETQSRRDVSQPAAQERPQPPRGRPDLRANAPGASRSTGPLRPGAVARTPGRPDTGSMERPRVRDSTPSREGVAPPARGQGRRQGNTQRPAQEPAPSRDRPGSGSGSQGRGSDAPKRETPPGDNARRPSTPSDQVIEKLFDGVRGERGRTRVEPPRVPPPQAPRPEVKRQNPQRPTPTRPPAPTPRPKPKEGDDKGKGR